MTELLLARLLHPGGRSEESRGSGHPPLRFGSVARFVQDVSPVASADSPIPARDAAQRARDQRRAGGGPLRDAWCWWRHLAHRRELWEQPGPGETPVLIAWDCARCGTGRAVDQLNPSGVPRGPLA